MKTKKLAAILGLLLTPFVGAGKQAPAAQSDLHAEIQHTYNFQPHTLNHEQILEKSKTLDQFWAKATSQRDVYSAGLRRELADFSNPPFFLFDGSKLLLSLSKDPADRKIALAAISRCDLRDVQLLDYFYLVHDMAAKGEDTTAAAFHILGEPKFQVFIPQHSLTLAQNYSCCSSGMLRRPSPTKPSAHSQSTPASPALPVPMRMNWRTARTELAKRFVQRQLHRTSSPYETPDASACRPSVTRLCTI
jgi:hypothetical protein